ncbi:PP2C family protein-serine/threonine phosphatase, partial [Kitasatospora sp. MBT66]|uniref:PP2C family protein-serine/threonine phosphatase n=1 Tax=Kitasatospora sp. MBT66 TaxID=1444769 RepID=UPI000D1509F6
HRPGAPAAETAVRGVIAGAEVEAHPSLRADGSVVWWLVGDTDRGLAAVVERERWELLARLPGLLLNSLNVDRCLETTAQQAAAHLADAAVVVSPHSGRALRFVTCLRDGRPVRGQVRADPAAVPGLAEALQGFPPVPSRWIDPETAPNWLLPEGLTAVGAVSVTPLPGHGVPAGALVLLRGPGHGAFTPSEEVFARLFAARAGAAVSAAVMYSEQAAITDLLMRELLPPRLEHMNGADFAGGYRASVDRDRVGGDFYDVHPAADPDGETLAVLGDVCGKGLEAAVLTGKIRNTLHALLPLADDHPRLLSLLNRALLTSHHTRFATMVLASVRRQQSRVTVRLSAAGHPAPLIVRADGRVEVSRTHGSLVGALPETTVVSDTVVLAPGEACVLYSDGVTEARG